MDLFTVIFYLVLIYIGKRLIHKILKIPQISNLGSRYILVTGCDTGFGNAIAKRLDALGCHVIATCLTESGETELRKSCSQKLRAIHMDVSNPDSVKKGHDEVTKILPPGKGLWGLINNAGIASRPGPVDWLNLDDYHKVTAVNLFGLIDVTMTFLPLIKKEKGRIVNTASMAGRLAAATGPYAVSKYGVEAFSDHLRRDMKDFKVSVSIIEPTYFTTGMTQTATLCKAMTDTYEALPQSIKDEYGREFVEIGEKNLGEMLNTSRLDDITPVLDAYTHGLLGMFPCARYPLGSQASLALFVQALPEWLGDRLLRTMSKRPKPTACK